MSKLPNNIKTFRLFRGLTQQEFASRIHKAQNTVANWEKGISSPDVDIVLDICNVLEITPNELYGWDKCKELEDYLSEQQKNMEEMQQLIQQRNDLDLRISEYQSKLRKGRIS